MDKVVFYSDDLGRDFEVESINFLNNTFVIRPDKAIMTLDGADRLLAKAIATARAEALMKIESKYKADADRLAGALTVFVNSPLASGWVALQEQARAALAAHEEGKQ